MPAPRGADIDAGSDLEGAPLSPLYPALCAPTLRPLVERTGFQTTIRRRKMDEFGTGFIKNVMISFFLALFVSFLFVWFPDMFRP